MKKLMDSRRDGRRRSKVRLVTLILLLSGVTVGSLAVRRQSAGSTTRVTPTKASEPSAVEARRVTLRKVIEQTFGRPIRVNGTLKSDEVVAVSTKATGLVQEVRVREGDRVRRGQLLIRIDDSELRAQRDKAAASLQSAEVRLAQALTSRGVRNAAVASDFNRAQQALATARTRVSQSKALAKIAATEVEASVESARASLRSASERLKTVQDGARRQERAQAELAVARAQTTVNKLKANLDRREQLFRQGAIAREEVENARRDHEGALVELASAREQKVHVGEAVSATSGELMTLVADETLLLEATAPEGDLPYLRIGAPAEVKLDAVPGKRLAGAIREIIPVAEGANRSVRVRIAVRKAEGVTVAVGRFARATLRGESAAPVLSVPLSAVISDEGETWTFVVVDGHARRRAIRVGATSGKQVEVLEGLRAGDHIIVDGTAGLTDGDAVTEGR